MTGLFQPKALDWKTVRGLCVQKGSHRLQHIHPDDRAQLAAAAAAVGLIVRVIAPQVLELRLAERRRRAPKAREGR